MRIITTEEHVSSEKLNEAIRQPLSRLAPYQRNASPPGLPYHVTARMLDVDEGRIAGMDAAGIDMQVLSYAAATQFISPGQARDVVGAANDELAEKAARYPGRFCAFAALPWSNPEVAAKELERAVKQLEMKGALLSGRPSPDAVFLDDPRFQDVLAAAAELQVPVYLHPGPPLPSVREAYYGGLDELVGDRLSLFGWGWHSEAGVQVIRMILAGVFDRHRSLQVISGHWGEMVPFFLSRLDTALPKDATGLQKEISEYYKSHVYVTPSGMFDTPHLKFTLEVVGADRIIYSVDYPFIGKEGAKAFLMDAPIGTAEKEMIAHSNAERLLKI